MVKSIKTSLGKHFLSLAPVLPECPGTSCPCGPALGAGSYPPENSASGALILKNIFRFERAVQVILLAAVLLMVSCRKEVDFSHMDLPQTPLLSQDVRWGGVSSLYAKLYNGADSGSGVVTLLRKGSLGQIQQKKKGWYYIKTPQYKGWIKDRDIMEFESSWQAFLSITQEEVQ